MKYKTITYKYFRRDKLLDRIKEMVFILPAILVALSFHEFAHAYVAYLFGDKSQMHRGRLTVNPIKHIDPVGFIMIALVGFGWAKPVVYDPNNIKKKKLGRVIIALAGPLSNFLLGIVFAFICGGLLNDFSFMLKAQNKSIQHFIFNLVLYISLINFGLGVFNLIPIAPLDGSHIIAVLFKLNPLQEAKYQRYGMPILLTLVFSDMLFGVDLLPISGIVTYLFTLFSGIIA